MIIATYLLAGMFAGLIAGLLGVGGGIIVVPVLILVFEAEGFSSDVLTHIAIGTSLATIVFTSFSSVLNHHRLGSVKWDLFKSLSIGIVVGAVLGVMTVLQLDGELLKRLIGVFAVVVALRMLWGANTVSSRPLPGQKILIPVGGVIGWVSSIFGIGGGTLSVPFLSRYQIEMRQVVGTAAACGLPIALAGALTNVVLGIGVDGRPGWSLGYVYLPALLGVSLASMVFAKFGAKLAHRLPSQHLKKIFACALILVGVRFLLV